jgi:tetratricopeptide (TPR) repeat protein
MTQSEAEKLFFKAVSKLEEGDISEAADLFSELISEYSDFGKAYNYLGLIYFRHFKDMHTAETHFKTAIALSPEFSESYVNYASLLFSQERFAEMNANLNKVSEIAGARKDKVYEQFALMHEMQGKYDDAVSFYKKAILATLSDEDLAMYEKAINRCNVKNKYM